MTPAEQDEKITRALQQRPRTIGALISASASILLYHSMVDPVCSANAGAEKVRLSLPGTLIGVVVLGVGLCLVLGGARSTWILRPQPGKSPTPSLIVWSVLGLAAVGLYLLTKSYLKTLGYS